MMKGKLFLLFLEISGFLYELAAFPGSFFLQKGCMGGARPAHTELIVP